MLHGIDKLDILSVVLVCLGKVLIVGGQILQHRCPLVEDVESKSVVEIPVCYVDVMQHGHQMVHHLNTDDNDKVFYFPIFNHTAMYSDGRN